MKNLIIATVAVVTLLFAAACGKKYQELPLTSGTAGPGEPGYTYQLTVDKLQFNWRVDGDLLRVKLKAPVQAWLSAGFNPGKGMQDAHMLIGYVENGKAVVTDQHGVDPKHHKPNAELGGKDTVKDVAGSQTAAGTEISFSTPLKSPDSLDRPIDPANAVVMLAYGNSNEIAQQHPFWAEAKVNLLTGAYSLTIARKGQ